MSVTVNKQLSIAKELFLSIALVAQEISSETVKMMKEDYSDSIIRNSVIKSLKKRKVFSQRKLLLNALITRWLKNI